MPELPEVQTITSDLKKHLEGYKIEQITVHGTYKAHPDRDEFISRLTDSTITRIHRIAKNIVIDLETSDSLIFHLAMTGQLLLSDPKTRVLPHERVTFVLIKDNKKLGLKFRDVRMFGKAMVIDKNQVEKLKNKYGPEPIQKDLSAEEFHEQIKSKKSTIKNVLLDQEIVSGLGNIYATDALFMAKIHPLTLSKDITSKQAENLLIASRDILNESISHRGSTLGDKMYVDAYGKYGSHQNHFRIYGKQKCDVCSTKVEIIKINGRGTYFCPSCQPEGNQSFLPL